MTDPNLDITLKAAEIERDDCAPMTARLDGALRGALTEARSALFTILTASVKREAHGLNLPWYIDQIDKALAAAVPSHGTAEGAENPPRKWVIASLRDLARDLLADPKTPWIGERDPKQHICWTAADWLEAPPPKPAPHAMREAQALADNLAAVLENIKLLKVETIVGTSVRSGPIALLETAQRLASENLREFRKRRRALAAKPADEVKEDVSPFEGLTALVQYRRKDDGITWRNMAAFDFFGPAERYRDKQDPEAPWEYRAVDLSTTGEPKP